ncbi:MAG: hypothetical protein LBT69_02165 [Lactobacillales bacterium]|jgi:hypothetical protein|nr:hypothetical protein [Lactobacillales bacterium]
MILFRKSLFYFLIKEGSDCVVQKEVRVDVREVYFDLQQEYDIARMNQQFRQFGLQIEFAENFKQEEQIDLFYFSVYEAKSCVGLVYGLYIIEEECLQIKKIFLLHEFRSIQNIEWILHKFLQLTKEQLNAFRFKWHYTIDGSKKDAYFFLLKNIPCIKVEKIISFRQYLVEISNFDHLRSLTWYKPTVFVNKGYEAILWQDCPEKIKQNILEREKFLSNLPTYLSPFIENFDTEDTKSSFILVKKDNQEPFGWMINEKISSEAVKIKRWYTYEHARGLRIGPSFASFVLERIAENNKRLVFEVAMDNLPMNRTVVNKYFKPILAQTYDVCQLDITLLE